MAFCDFEHRRYEKLVKAYLDKRRPPPHVRSQLDYAYRFKNQSVSIFEVRPVRRNPCEYMQHPIAKATYVKKQKIWKIYWQRADLKWHRYEPDPTTATLEDFFAIIERDDHGCFYG